jgi:hypothetical protein
MSAGGRNAPPYWPKKPFSSGNFLKYSLFMFSASFFKAKLFCFKLSAKAANFARKKDATKKKNRVSGKKRAPGLKCQGQSERIF